MCVVIDQSFSKQGYLDAAVPKPQKQGVDIYTMAVTTSLFMPIKSPGGLCYGISENHNVRRKYNYIQQGEEYSCIESSNKHYDKQENRQSDSNRRHNKIRQYQEETKYLQMSKHTNNKKHKNNKIMIKNHLGKKQELGCNRSPIEQHFISNRDGTPLEEMESGDSQTLTQAGKS